MSTPNPDDRDRFATEVNEAPSSRSTVASIVWILLLVALIALGIWWYSQQADVQTPAVPPAIEAPLAVDQVPSQVPPATTLPSGPAAATPTSAPEEISPRKPAAPSQPAVARNREPVPLASNRIPVYPGQALRSGVEGSVSVLIEVDASGMPTEVRVVQRSGERSRELDRAVLTAARSWRFEPAIRNGRPAPGQVVLPVQFKRD